MLWLLLIILIILILIYLWYRNQQDPSTQVVNNSATLVFKVKVGSVEFTENLSMCGEGCSTGFIDVPDGDNNIMLQVEDGGAWVDLGNVGPFGKNKLYAVNIRITGSYCAELWRRHQADSTFNDDTSKELVSSNCS